MKKSIGFLVLMIALMFIFPSSAFAQDIGEDRESQQYDESAYELMSYSDSSWYELGENTTNSIASSIKEFMWMVNLITANVVMMIVYQMFSLDIVDITIHAVNSIASTIADGLLTTFGAFALAIFSIGIIVKAYIQQNWQAFIKLVSLVVISLALLSSIASERFDYITFAHGLSVQLENMVMNVNPSLTGDSDFDPTNMNSTAVALENKVFDALVYKPYLLLQYGTTDEAAILAEDPERITDYLEADPRTEEGVQTRQDIARTEYVDYENYNIFAGNGFKQTGYILVMFLSTVVQGVVYFFIALLRIMLQFGFVVMLLLAPFAIFLSIFPSFETVIGKYARTLGLLIVFKAVVMFFILVAVSFISLGYDMTNTTDDLYYRIFMQIIMSVATIFLYTKRQAVMNMIEGSSLSVDDMGGGALPRLRKNHVAGGRFQNFRNKIPRSNKGNKLKDKVKGGVTASTNSIKKAGTNLGEKSKNVASLSKRRLQATGENVKQASARFAEHQRGESYEQNVYEGNTGERAAMREVAATSESGSRFSQARQSVVTRLNGEESLDSKSDTSVPKPRSVTENQPVRQTSKQVNQNGSHQSSKRKIPKQSKEVNQHKPKQQTTSHSPARKAPKKEKNVSNQMRKQGTPTQKSNQTYKQTNISNTRTKTQPKREVQQSKEEQQLRAPTQKPSKREQEGRLGHVSRLNREVD
ncbi:CD3337/EF1877 family mobilome membrane protein [Alkalihalobacterium sp. APHAB7]|uniref:CD3337/EF1877 family mobilome membrane protein n=1 Tax=Alkalihalobacterium sp. APHAB7 TaxID=3402081 RepID=UPI003AAB7265